MANDLIKVSALRHEYGGAAVLDLPEWCVPRGARSLIVGRSGSGKSTLLHALAGILRPSAGSIAVDATLLETLSGAALDRFRGRNIGIVLQRLHLIRALTVRENLRLTQRLAGLAQDDARIEQVMTGLGLAQRLDAKPHELSYGQQQRVAIARAVINRPKLMLADEPTSNLDDDNCLDAIQLLFEQARDCGATLVVATHDARIRPLFEQELVLEARA
jgi:putative ABC transport system ATP-binding protein